MKKKFDPQSFSWSGVSQTTYADEHLDNVGRSSRDKTRHIIKGKEDGGTFDVRYFEVAPAGFTSLECHEHIHSVICVRGHGYAIVGGSSHDVCCLDNIYGPVTTPHKLVH